MRSFFLLIILQFYNSTILPACECPPLNTLNEEYCAQYDLIFSGSINSVTPCNEKASAILNVDKLFKGKAKSVVEIFFDCTTSCQMTLLAGEQWIIYANYTKYAVPEVSFCSRSRKKFDNDTLDYYTATHALTFNQELEELKNTIGVKSILQEEERVDIQRELVKPKGYTLLWLLVISIVVVGALLYFSKGLKR